KRAGSYLTLRDLIEEAGRDATRWFLVARKPDSQLVFDVDLARSQSLDNPVYYVQLSHARICGLLRQRWRRGRPVDRAYGLAQPRDAGTPASPPLAAPTSRWPARAGAARQLLPPRLVGQSLLERARSLHSSSAAAP